MKSTILACFVLLFSTVLLNGQNSTTTKNTPAKTARATKKVPTKAATVKAKTDETVKSVGTATPAPPPPVNGTGGMPVMKFEAKNYEFGKIKMGDKPEFTYKFKNTGNAPLDIEIVSGCDCTELDWTRSTVQPGESGYVKAVYNSNKAEKDDHKKQLKKYIDIVLKQTHPSNGYPLVESLTFNVFIVD
jgi:Protein of unknown function (DUF1573)